MGKSKGKQRGKVIPYLGKSRDKLVIHKARELYTKFSTGFCTELPRGLSGFPPTLLLLLINK